jgi:competence ComEA-like helix-hairpin-helix protein
VIVLLLLLPLVAWSQVQLPEGPGRAELEKLCKNCHELARSVSKQQDRDGWQATMAKMVAFGMKGTEDEHKAIVDYLTRNFGAELVPPIKVNEASAIELESGLSLRRSQAAAVIAYRKENGPFKSLADLKKVPGIEPAKIDAKRDRIVF